MKDILTQEFAFPDCSSNEPKIVKREGGWQGGVWTLRVGLDDACYGQWVDGIAVKSKRCELNANELCPNREIVPIVDLNREDGGDTFVTIIRTH